MNNKINQCTITLTRNCNLRCNFCYAKKTGYVTNELIEYENLKQIVDLCNNAKVKYIVLTGGEPTLYPKLLEIIKYIKSRKHKMIATIATNATKLDDMNYCKQLIESGLDYIDVSLKGKDKLSYATVTGCDYFEQQMKAINNLSQLIIDFTCSMVVTQYNVDTFCEAVKNAYDNGARQFSFTFVIDNEKSIERDLQYLEKHNPFILIESFIAHIDELNSITNGEWWIEYSYPMCVYTEKQLSILKGRLAAPCQIFYRNGITFDGKMNLIPCSMNIENKMGQFKTDFSTLNELNKIMETDIYKSTIDSLNKLPSISCKTCKHLNTCLGGCTFFWEHCSFEAFSEFKEKYYK